MAPPRRPSRPAPSPRAWSLEPEPLPSLPAVIVSASLNDPAGLFGFFGSWTPPALPSPVIREFEWPWARPLAAILSFAGWTIDRVVSDRRVALEVHRLWKLWKWSRREAAEAERRREREVLLWLRRQGCPVPCPACSSRDACACSVGPAP